MINTTTSASVGITYDMSVGIIRQNELKIDKSLIEYIDLLYQVLDVDMDYNKFKNLSTSEKQAFIRDIKIKKVLDHVIPQN